MPTKPFTTVTVLPPRPAVCRMISTRPRFFRAGFASVRSPESAGELSCGGEGWGEGEGRVHLPGYACFGGLLIAEIRELERHWKVLRPHCRDHRLQVVPALAGHADLFVLNLRRHFELCLADEASDLFGDI